MKFYSICMVCIMSLLIPVSGVAGFGDIGRKIGKLLKSREILEAEQAEQVFEHDLRGAIRHITGEDLPGNATREEILVGFREAYIKAAADTEAALQGIPPDRYGDFSGAGLYDHYRELVFQNQWWEVDDFREVMFPVLLKEDVVGKHGNPVNLMKWWKQAKVMGEEDRLRGFTLLSFRKHGISMEDIVFLRNGNIALKPEIELKLGFAIEQDPFLSTVLSATMSNASFTEQWKRLMFEDPAVPREGIIEQDFDIEFRNGLPPQSTGDLAG